jgi:hypothetical protein
MKIILPELHPGQQDLLRKIQDPNTDYLLVNIGRQWGKTHFGVTLAILSVAKPNTYVGWVGRVNSTSKIAFDKVLEYLTDSGVISKKNTSTMEIHFTNGSRMKFFSGERYEFIRGQSIDLIICDEFAMFKPEAWDAAIEPTIIARKGSKVVLLSTPRGKNWYYHLWNRAISNHSDKWKCVTAPSWDSPLPDPAKLADIKARIADNIWRQEYGAEFIDNTSSLFENVIQSATSDLQWDGKSAVTIGIDIGFKNDYTVAVAIDQTGKIVGYFRANDNNLNFELMTNRLLQFINNYKNPTIWCESNKYDSIPTLLRKKGITVNDFTTTAASKKQIIDNLITQFKIGGIKLPQAGFNNENDYFISEFQDYTMIYNQTTGNISFDAPAGLHDDCVIATAIALWQINQIPKAMIVDYYIV